MSRYIPAVLGVLLIVVGTFIQINMTDRFSTTNVSAEQQAKLLKNIPISFGDWRGEDMQIDPTVRQTAGAIGAVSRTYRNIRTNETVELWLVVGHARDISAHTPNICYQASGFEKRAPDDSLYPMSFNGQTPAQFWTNTFFQEDAAQGRRLMRRVFWSWYNPENDANEGRVVWEAPENPRHVFGNTRALYKMYFTSEMRDLMETTEQSSCLRFARDFLPIVSNALAQVYSENPTADPGVATDAAPSVVPADAASLTQGDAAAVGSTAENAGNQTPSAEVAPPTDSGAAETAAPKAEK
jgi:hypothetical protein